MRVILALLRSIIIGAAAASAWMMVVQAPTALPPPQRDDRQKDAGRATSESVICAGADRVLRAPDPSGGCPAGETPVPVPPFHEPAGDDCDADVDDAARRLQGNPDRRAGFEHRSSPAREMNG